jgi:hypothetical protein
MKAKEKIFPNLTQNSSHYLINKYEQWPKEKSTK